MNKVAFVFPGQGSQYQGMGKYYYDNNEIARRVFEEASDSSGMDIKKLCFETEMAELTKTENAQPAILTASYAAYQVFMKEGLEPSFMAGHSLGEITALTCAGAISFSDAIRLVRARGRIMQKACEQSDGSMAAIKGLVMDAVEELCKKYSVDGKVAVVSNYNSVDQIVVSGHKDAVIQVGEAAKKENGKYTLLKVSAPFHSPLMNNAIVEFRNELQKYKYNDIKYPVVANVTAKAYQSSDKMVDMLSKHLVSPVLWKNTIDFFVENDVGLVVELGPKNVLKNLVKGCTDKIRAFSFDEPDGMPELMDLVADLKGKSAEALEAQTRLENSLRAFMDKIKELYRNNKKENALPIRGSEDSLGIPTPVTLCLAGAVCTPNKNRNNKEFQAGVVEPYKKIRRLQAVIEKEQREPNEEEIEEAFNMLLSVFKTKKVAANEQLLQLQLIYDRLAKAM